MEVDTLLESLQSMMLANKNRLQDIDARREELKRVCTEEANKISAQCTEAQTRISMAGESLRSKLTLLFKKLDEDLDNSRDCLDKNMVELLTDLDKIKNMVTMGEGHRIDTGACWAKIEQMIHPTLNQYNPTFHATKTLAKLKSSDLGFINTAEFHPNQYQLSLTSPTSNILDGSINKKIICAVHTSQLFTDMIQAEIKFSIKKKGSKEAVPYCKEDCKLSEDKRSFQIAFLMTGPGTFVVTVLLYDQHVVDSPLTIIASESKINNTRDNIGQLEIPETAIESKKTEDLLIVKSEVPAPQITQNAVLPNTSPVTSTKLLGTRPSITSCNLESSAAFIEPEAAPAISSSVPASSKSVTPSSAASRLVNAKPKPYTAKSVQSFLPPGPLDLSNLVPGSKLTGLRMLSIEEGVKEESLHKPIGMCLLLDGNIAVASTFENKVKIYSPEGRFMTQVSCPEPPFDRPSDMVTLHSGQFVVRDNSRVQVFRNNGSFLKTMWQDKGQDRYRCYGLAQDKEGRLVTIMESRRPRNTSLQFFNVTTGELVKVIKMEDIANKALSKCRFLTYQQDKFYITDLGLDCVYILDPENINSKQVVGVSGSGPGELSDPAGLVVDIAGNIIVADSKNHRLCVFNSEGKFACHVTLSPAIRRPSGVALNREEKELFVLNLQGKMAMIKYKLK